MKGKFSETETSNSLNPQRARKRWTFFSTHSSVPACAMMWFWRGISCVHGDCKGKDQDDDAAHKIGHHEELMWTTTANKTRRIALGLVSLHKSTGNRTAFVAFPPTCWRPTLSTGTRDTRERRQKWEAKKDKITSRTDGRSSHTIPLSSADCRAQKGTPCSKFRWYSIPLSPKEEKKAPWSFSNPFIFLPSFGSLLYFTEIYF